MEKSFGRKVLEQSAAINENITAQYFEIDMESEDTVLTQQDAIIQQIEIWMNTNTGERNWDPDYGNPLIVFIHKSETDITATDIEDFFTKMEAEIDTIQINRDDSTAIVENSILKIRMRLRINGIVDEVSLRSDIS